MNIKFDYTVISDKLQHIKAINWVQKKWTRARLRAKLWKKLFTIYILTGFGIKWPSRVDMPISQIT